MAAAAENEDFAELAACMDPASRSEMAQGLLMASTMMVAFAGFGEAMAGEIGEGMAEAFGEEGEAADAEALAAAQAEAAAEVEALTNRYRDVLAAHGLERMMDEEPSGEADLDEMLAEVDDVALVGDLMDFMASFPGSEEEEDEGSMLPTDITDFQIDGDSATAQSPEGPVEFVRIDGRWFFKADTSGE
jgi:hypothetical protein